MLRAAYFPCNSYFLLPVFTFLLWPWFLDLSLNGSLHNWSSQLKLQRVLGSRMVKKTQEALWCGSRPAVTGCIQLSWLAVVWLGSSWRLHAWGRAVRLGVPDNSTGSLRFRTAYQICVGVDGPEQAKAGLACAVYFHTASQGHSGQTSLLFESHILPHLGDFQ